jgi:hypothetical protein
VFVLALLVAGAFAQETTGGLQGVVRDPSGAVVANAHVELIGSSLVGKKESQTDSGGYYRFANLPPGTYTLKITAQGFSTAKREGLTLEVGHLPTVDFKLEVGASSTVVEVTSAAPEIDVSTVTTQTNINQEVVQDVPHGRSFQSVIQFAPSARNEPLAGSTGNQAMSSGGNGTGGQSPGSGGNGQGFGFSVAGGADSENSYLVEGQETADSIGGFSHSNVPFDFIQEVQVKTSGIEAEHGGALGGVINVVMKKGSNNWHGSVFSQFEKEGWDGSPTAFDRYDPTYGTTLNGNGSAYLDPNYQEYQPKKDKYSDIFPGATFGGPLWRDKVWFFAGFNPEWNDTERNVVMNAGPTSFSRNYQTYYTYGRLDAAITQKVRVFGSWLYQYARESGSQMPFADSTTGLLNPSTSCYGTFTSATNPCFSSGTPAYAFSHALGSSAPNVTTNVGADFTLTPRLVGTVRWGYAFQNYHDFGFPTTGNINIFQTSGAGADVNCNPVPPATTCTGAAIPTTSPLYQSGGYFNIANNINTTGYDATKRNQVDADLAWFKSGWWGTHNIKGGYQLTRTSNTLLQHWNTPEVDVFAGAGNFYNVQGSVGQANCLNEAFVNYNSNGTVASCAGLYGYASIRDYGSNGEATSNNNGLFIQDAWTIGRGVTINLGIRVEKEYLPAEDQPAGGISKPINFGWGDKIAPRIGAAWDVFRDGRMKVFGSYGVFNDTMKLNLAISSFGGQYWQNCYYAMDTDQIQNLNPVFNSAGRYCVGPNSASEANFPGGVGATPAGYTFLENQNFRTFPTSCSTCTATEEGVAPGLKPYRQHEDVFGIDYQLKKNLAFEARWDRIRNDHVIEDSAIFNPNIGETFVIVNPGQGVNKTFDGFYNFLYGNSSACGTTGPNSPGPCPPNNIPAARSYDGLELRLTKMSSQHWYGMVSYTYSHFRGNYTGLTSTDIGDGGGGRNAPNNSRAFDEPFFSWGANGESSSGNLPTDRPSSIKGYAYYELNHKRFSTDFGLFQFAYEGTPQTTIADVGYSFAPPAGAFPTYLVGRGKWVDVTQDPGTGIITTGNPRVFRTPWYVESDFNLQENYKIGESKVLSYSITIPNLLNQRATTAYYPFLESQNFGQFLAPGGNELYQANSVAAYYAFETGYNWQSLLTTMGGNTPKTATGTTGIATINSNYGKPYLEQISRTIRMGVKFTF